MAKRSYEERIADLVEKEENALEKARYYKEQKRDLEKQKKEKDRKARDHRLIVIGGAVESVLGREIAEEEIPKLIGFLKREDKNGSYFLRAMRK